MFWMTRGSKVVMMALPLVALACASSSIKMSHAPDYDFLGVKTYAIETGQFTTDNPSLMGRGTMEMLAQAARRDLSIYKELAEVPADSADVIVKIDARTQRQRDTDPVFETDAPTKTTGRGRYYDAGTLVVNIVDRATGNVVWHGTTEKVVTALSQDGVDRVMSQLLENFPPRAKMADG